MITGNTRIQLNVTVAGFEDHFDTLVTNGLLATCAGNSGIQNQVEDLGFFILIEPHNILTEAQLSGGGSCISYNGIKGHLPNAFTALLKVFNGSRRVAGIILYDNPHIYQHIAILEGKLSRQSLLTSGFIGSRHLTGSPLFITLQLIFNRCHRSAGIAIKGAIQIHIGDLNFNGYILGIVINNIILSVLMSIGFRILRGNLYVHSGILRINYKHTGLFNLVIGVVGYGHVP